MEIYVSEQTLHTYDCMCYTMLFENAQIYRNINEVRAYYTILKLK